MRQINLCLFFILLTIQPVSAATYYVCGSATSCNTGSSGWSTGASGNTGLSKSVPKATITQGLAAMAASDTLIVGNGTYVNDQIIGTKSGSSGAYTIVETENIGGVTINMTNGSTPIDISTGYHHIQVEGFRALSENGGVTVYGSYCKILRVAAFNSVYNSQSVVFSFGTGSDHNLAEECWAWGGGRYKFITYQATNNIFRRCVSRHDYNNDGGGEGTTQQATFVNYDSTNSQFQNCIAIDSGVAGSGQNIYGGFWDENNDNVDKTGKITGSIVLNIRTNQTGIGEKISGTRTITNTVIWDGGGGYGAHDRGAASYAPHARLDQNTIGHIIDTGIVVYGDYGPGAAMKGNWDGITNRTIITDAYSYAIGDYMVSDYNALYNNGYNYGGTEHTSVNGAHDITNVNPLTNCLKYLPRIESTNCSLYTEGSNGSRIGAEIIYKHGTSGTLYGETGYDTLTSDPLWPFPNEALIKTDFASYSGPGPAGARGFATGTSIDGSPQSLTKYIWEYLDNEMPSIASIYGEEEPTGPMTYYVSPSGSDTNGCTNSTTDVCLTIQKAVNLTVAGDTVLVADGTYRGFYVNKEGTETNRITIKASGTSVNIDSPLWFGYGTNEPTERTYGINLEGYDGVVPNYITIDGFHVYGMPDMGIRAIGGTGDIIQNCVAHNNQMGIFSGGTPGIQVLNNITYANGETSNDHNIYVSNADSDGAIIRGNTVYGSTTGNGIQLNGDWYSGGDGFIDNAIVEDNFIYDNHQKGISLISVRYARIQNNVIHNNGISAGGIHVVDENSSHFSTGNILVNNTIVEPDIACVRINAYNEANVVFNNICVGDAGIVFEGGGNFQSNNTSANTATFVNFAAHDYRLLAINPAVDGGLSTYQGANSPTDDIIGTDRDSSVDIGAYEFYEAPVVPSAVLTGGSCSGCTISN